MDAIELLYYGLDILGKIEENDLSKQDIALMRNTLNKLVDNYLCDRKKFTISFADMYCEVCRAKQEHKIVYNDGDRIITCCICGNMEVI